MDKKEILDTLQKEECYYILLSEKENAAFTLAIYRKNALQMLFKVLSESGTQAASEQVQQLLLDYAGVLYDIDKLFYQILLQEFDDKQTASQLLDTSRYVLNADVFQKTIQIEKVEVCQKKIQ